MQTARNVHITLDQKYLDAIHEAAASFSEIENVYLFGSRVLKTFRKGSDIDIALKGKNVTRSTLLRMHDRLNEEAMIPYFVDIVDYNFIQNDDLKDHIHKYGVVIYEKKT